MLPFFGKQCRNLDGGKLCWGPTEVIGEIGRVIGVCQGEVGMPGPEFENSAPVAKFVPFDRDFDSGLLEIVENIGSEFDIAAVAIELEDVGGLGRNEGREGKAEEQDGDSKKHLRAVTVPKDREGLRARKGKLLALSAGLFEVAHLRRCFHRSAGHVVDYASEVFEAGGGDDDGVAATVDVFGDAEEASAGVLLEGEDESFALDLDFVRAEGVFDYGWFGTLVAASSTAAAAVSAVALSMRSPRWAMAVRRWTFI